MWVGVVFLHQIADFIEMGCSLFDSYWTGTLKKVEGCLGVMAAGTQLGGVLQASGWGCVDGEPVKQEFLDGNSLIEGEAKEGTSVTGPIN